ncbi:MAG: hypothetical protein K5866_04805 [Treponema sp.]|nr:hypothetical protein [Treponema sp.]
MQEIDRLRELAGNKSKCLKILKKAEKTIDEGRICCELKCSDSAESYYIVNKWDKDGTVLDDKKYLAPFCEKHSAVNSVNEIKYQTKFIEV